VMIVVKAWYCYCGVKQIGGGHGRACDIIVGTVNWADGVIYCGGRYWRLT